MIIISIAGHSVLAVAKTGNMDENYDKRRDEKSF